MYRLLIKIRSRLLVFLTHNMALPFLRFVRRPELFPHTAASLLEMPAGTLGKDLYDFLQKRSLQLLPHYAKHDLKHIILEYDTTDEGEVCLQCFMLGNGHISFPVAATVLYGFVTMPEYWKKFRHAYRRGSRSVSIDGWKWPELVTENTLLLKEKLNKINYETSMV